MTCDQRVESMCGQTATLSMLSKCVGSTLAGGLQITVHIARAARQVITEKPHQLKFPNGKLVTAYNVLSEMLQRLELVDNEGMFALWVMSPLLGNKELYAGSETHEALVFVVGGGVNVVRLLSLFFFIL